MFVFPHECTVEPVFQDRRRMVHPSEILTLPVISIWKAFFLTSSPRNSEQCTFFQTRDSAHSTFSGTMYLPTTVTLETCIVCVFKDYGCSANCVDETYRTEFIGLISCCINLLATDFFFSYFSTPVFKMWVIQKPNKVALWNKQHFEEKKCRLYSMFQMFSTDICWINIKWGI